MENSIQKYSYQEIQSFSDIFVKSGFFKDIKNQAEASVKIIAGQEIGLMPFQSLQGIDIIQGKVYLKPIMMSGLLKRVGKYDYKITENTEKICKIEFLENGKKIGDSIFSINDAAQQGLSGKDNWKKQPKIMLFYRALSQGIKMFCPDLFLMPVYNEADDWRQDKQIEEKPVEIITSKSVDIETGEIKEAEPIVIETKKETNYITQAQRNRLFAIKNSLNKEIDLSENCKKAKDELYANDFKTEITDGIFKEYLLSEGYKSTSEIPKDRYNEFVELMQDGNIYRFMYFQNFNEEEEANIDNILGGGNE